MCIILLFRIQNHYNIKTLSRACVLERDGLTLMEKYCANRRAKRN